MAAYQRRFPLGAEVTGRGDTHFRVWAPSARKVEVAIESSADPDASRTFYALEGEPGGYFAGPAPAGAGALYRYRIDEADHLHPDPASRFQPEGPHRSSRIVDPAGYRWRCDGWRGLPLKGQIFYELHVGTFTPEGTYRAAAGQLAELADAGISVIEMMPIAEFAGRFGWGYDGVNPYAPFHGYGEPDDLRAFVDAAHSHGIAVILDVVYNHLGPEGNYLGVYSRDYFTDRYKNEWGEAINFDGENAAPVREFFVTNARYWITEFRFDGFRLDATQSIFDASPTHILRAICEAARAAAPGRQLILIAENEPQETRLVRAVERGGYGLDALWNDDFHHSAVVALTGKREAYYTDYRGTPQEFISAAKYGYLFQGQRYAWQKQRRGSPALTLPPETFIAYIENHDQVANTADGERLRRRASPGRYRAMTALLLLGPWTPLLFQGQEFGATSPFLYFTDLNADLHEAVRKGRVEFLAQFPSIAGMTAQAQLADPFAEETFAACKLRFSERETNRPIYDLHRDLLRLRRDDARFNEQRPHGVDGAVLAPGAFVLRYFDPAAADDRLLVVNFGVEQNLEPAPEPLVAPPLGCEWDTFWSSDDIRYGGPGARPAEVNGGWLIAGECAVVLRPKPLGTSTAGKSCDTVPNNA